MKRKSGICPGCGKPKEPFCNKKKCHGCTWNEDIAKVSNN